LFLKIKQSVQIQIKYVGALTRQKFTYVHSGHQLIKVFDSVSQKIFSPSSKEFMRFELIEQLFTPSQNALNVRKWRALKRQ
jgi:hypothetical protein